MAEKKRPIKTPWQITNFPPNLRLQLTIRAKLRGTTIPCLIAQIIKEWLNKEEQRQELPVPQEVLEDE